MIVILFYDSATIMWYLCVSISLALGLLLSYSTHGIFKQHILDIIFKAAYAGEVGKFTFLPLSLVSSSLSYSNFLWEKLLIRKVVYGTQKQTSCDCWMMLLCLIAGTPEMCQLAVLYCDSKVSQGQSHWLAANM